MLDFDQLSHFKSSMCEILNLIPHWSTGYGVEEAAIERQIYEAHCWCLANPKRAPKRNVTRFLHNWMRIARQMGNLVKEHPLYKQQIPEEDQVMTGEDWRRMREAIGGKK